MKVEQLLITRYKVIADYPLSTLKIGDIICFDGIPKPIVKGGAPCNNFGYLENYPHLFEKLEWWDCRKQEELPSYLKIMHSTKGLMVLYMYEGGAYYERVDKMGPYMVRYKEGGGTLMRYFEPATEPEYKEYINRAEREKIEE